ncbi:sigma-70 family RNA polymerase sigma factor [Corallococcus sicarius]|uniref:Sigma-70 family RNA polymerase sigma factor n=1 Tax=Corallococcus sicarius TaxID=2316726 RepID=A0A3A8MYZ4_9BACT|nr:sigma-70 family RNA polymerase sigma factor [Corallococcus sicarius]
MNPGARRSPWVPIPGATASARDGGSVWPVTAPSTPLASAFIAALDEEHVPAPGLEQLESLLTASVEHARSRWPGIALEPEAFVAFVAERLPPGASVPEVLGATSAIDELYLAFGCLRHHRVALQRFEDTYLREVGAFVSGVDRSPAFVDEVRQLLRERLFAASAGSEPKISEFTGSGALGGWVRVAALRIALNLKRSEARADSAARESVEAALGEDLGPELQHLRSHYREAFTEAVRASLGQLTDRDRTLLRLYHVEALSLEAIAALYRVHLSTVSRWLSRAREQVAEATTQQLCKRLGVGPSSVNSIAALVVGQIDLSLTRLLKTGG